MHELRSLLFLALLASVSVAKDFGGDGTWDTSEGDRIQSHAGFIVSVMEIGGHDSGNGTALDNATYEVSWNGTVLEEITLWPGSARNVTVNGTGRVKHYLLQLRLKDLGFHDGEPFAETGVSSAIFFHPPPPALLSLNVSAGIDGANVSWATSVPANATLAISGVNFSKTIAITPRRASNSVIVAGLFPSTAYSLNLTYCVASCNSSGSDFTTLAAPPQLEEPAEPPDVSGRPAPSLHELSFLVALPLAVIVIYLIHRK